MGEQRARERKRMTELTRKEMANASGGEPARETDQWETEEDRDHGTQKCLLLSDSVETVVFASYARQAGTF